MTNSTLTDDRIISLLNQFKEDSYNDATDSELMAALIELQERRKAADEFDGELEAQNKHIAELESRHRQRDRNDFIRGITHPASLYTADEAAEAIAEYDRKHGNTDLA